MDDTLTLIASLQFRKRQERRETQKIQNREDSKE